jgi:diguanylate cyclase (GGDEF)-like protein/PAS domain S-box-containing protein
VRQPLAVHIASNLRYPGQFGASLAHFRRRFHCLAKRHGGYSRSALPEVWTRIDESEDKRYHCANAGVKFRDIQGSGMDGASMKKKPSGPIDKIVSADPGFYKELLDHTSDGVYFVDRERRIQYWNEGACRLTGYQAEDLLGKRCQDDILCHVDYSGKRLCHDGCPLTASIADGVKHEANVFLLHKQGRRVPVNVRVRPIRGADGSIIGAVEIFSDDSAQTDALRKAEDMNRLAFLDHLTDLPNRRFLEMSINTALSEYQVHHDPFGLLLADLDRFKDINDTFGHSCGDRALQEVAKTLVGSLRPTDIVGRWGGDEFLAITGHVDHEILRELAERCVTMVKETSISGNDERLISLSISVGATLVGGGVTAEELIQRADQLLYESKTAGRNRATTEKIAAS